MKKSNILRSIGIVFVILEALAIFGTILDKNFDIFLVHNIDEFITLIGFLLFGIIGAILIFISYKVKK